MAAACLHPAVVSRCPFVSGAAWQHYYSVQLSFHRVRVSSVNRLKKAAGINTPRQHVVPQFASLSPE